MVRDRRADRSFAARVPGVMPLAGLFQRVAAMRAGRVPVGLLALLPVSLFIDLFDIGDELVGGPIGVGLSFLLESAFLLALTGRAGYAIGIAGLDVIPLVDTLPWATITLAREILAAWSRPVARAPEPPTGPIIDV